MKYLITITVIAIVLGTGGVAYATTTPPVIQHGGNIIVNLVTPWGLTVGQTPTVGAGETFADEYGVVSSCPKFYRQGCHDLTHTDYYRGRMMKLARDLVNKEIWGAFPMFQGWVNIILAGR